MKNYSVATHPTHRGHTTEQAPLSDRKSPQPNLRKESVHHFLIVCPVYARQRHELQNEIAPRVSEYQHMYCYVQNLDDPQTTAPKCTPLRQPQESLRSE